MSLLVKTLASIALLLPTLATADGAAPVSPATQPARADWQGESGTFWYERPLGEKRHEFRLVDLGAKTDEPVCDHARLAAGLTKSLGQPLHPDRLPLERLTVSREFDWFRFRTMGRRWHFNPSTGWLRGLPDDIDPDPLVPVPEKSAPVNEDDESFLLLHNHTQYNAICYWLSEGMEPKAYGTLAPGETREQHTYAGHEWKVETPGGLRLATLTARAGRQPVELREPGTSTPAPWLAEIQGTTLHLRHSKTGTTSTIDFAPDHPTTDLRSSPTGRFLAIRVIAGTTPAWRFYELATSGLQPHPIPVPAPVPPAQPAGQN